MLLCHFVTLFTFENITFSINQSIWILKRDSTDSILRSIDSPFFIMRVVWCWDAHTTAKNGEVQCGIGVTKIRNVTQQQNNFNSSSSLTSHQPTLFFSYLIGTKFTLFFFCRWIGIQYNKQASKRWLLLSIHPVFISHLISSFIYYHIILSWWCFHW